MGFYDEPATDRVLFCTIGYARGPETRVYMDRSDANLSRSEVVAALNGWVVDREALAAATERAERAEAERDEEKSRVAYWVREHATMEADCAKAEAELALRKDYADQVRAQSATIIRLGNEIEAADRARDAEKARADRAEELAGRRAVVLGFFRSVIHCGEPWTERCQLEYDAAMTEDGAALRKAKEESGGAR